VYDVLLEIGIVVLVTILRDNPDQYFEIFLTPVTFDSSCFYHSESKNSYFSILMSIFFRRVSGRICCSITFYDFLGSPQYCMMSYRIGFLLRSPKV